MPQSETEEDVQTDIVLVEPDHSSHWAVEFPNPHLTDARDEPVVVRRDLGTSDDERAVAYVEELGELLAEKGLEVGTPSDFRETYSDVVLDAVFAGTEEEADYEQRRSEALGLPWHQQDYTRVMFVGTTGAGKTTLLRNLIGSNHHTDKFPSTSAGRTTTADIEIITGQDDYKGVVTFQSERLVRGQIEECVLAAALEGLKGHSKAEVADALLEHEDQTFRLKYILGDWQEPDDSEEMTEDDPWAFGGALDEESELEEEPAGIDKEEEEWFLDSLRGYVDRIDELAQDASVVMQAELNVTWDEEEPLPEDVEDDFERFVRNRPGYNRLINDLLDEIILRFKWIENPEALHWSDSGWPTTWEYETDDRDEFLERMRWFASNYAPRYGKLLTPVVQGMRVQGPFQSEFADENRKFVFIDGKGLGHKASEAGSITSSITSRFGAVDVILVVDNATQPMQKNPLEAIRTAAVSGHVSKLGVAFTHFDAVEGDNLPTLKTRAEHVRKALKQGVRALEEDGSISSAIVRQLKTSINDRSFLLGWLHQAVTKMENRKLVEREVRRMFDWFEETADPTDKPQATPVYELDDLLAAVREGNRNFLTHWRALLGLEEDEGPEKEHWTRIKALNRRVVERRNNYEYDNLRPIADLIRFVMDELSLELEDPVEVESYGANKADKQLAIDLVRQKVHEHLHALFTERLVVERRSPWRVAYSYSGTGSTSRRAEEIDEEVLDPAAPEYRNVDDSKLPAVFGDSVKEAIQEAVREGGGQVRSD